MKRAKGMKKAIRRAGIRALALGPLTFLLVAGPGCQSLFGSSGDQADPSTWSPTVRALDEIDGGDLDAEDIDAEGIDAESLDAESFDAEPVDAEPSSDAVADANAQQDVVLVNDANPPLDGGTTQLDGGVIPVVDAQWIDVGAIDGGALDGGVVLDVPRGADTQGDGGYLTPVDTAADGQVAGSETGPETGPDTTPPAVEPGPDAAAPPVNPDAAPPPVKNDAAVVPPATDIKVLGGGFCALSQSRAASPAGFALLALGALALLRRRRR